MNVSRINRYLIGLSLFVGYTLFALAWKAGDFYITNTGYDNNDLSTLIAALNISKVIVNVAAGVLTAKLLAEQTFLNNSKLFVVGCFAIAGAMFALPMSESFIMIAVSRALLGFGGALVLFTMNPLVADIFPENELPIINGLNSSAFNIGIALMLSLGGVMAMYPGAIATTVATLALLSGILFMLANRSGAKIIKEKLNNQNTLLDKTESKEEEFGIVDALKDTFNWLFSLTFTGIIAFYYVAFTFLDGQTVMYMMYAGIAGNMAGIVGAKTLKHITVARFCSSISLLLAAAFMFTLGGSLSKFIGVVLGFTIFFSLPSYVTLAFSQKNATPKRIGLSFMMLWVISDLLATGILKVYAQLSSQPSTEAAATIFILGITSFFTIGCYLLKGSDATVNVSESALDQQVA